MQLLFALQRPQPPLSGQLKTTGTRKTKEDQRRGRQTSREGAIDVDVHTIQSLEFPDGIMAPTHCHLFSYLEDHLSSSARFSMSTLTLWIITFSLKNWLAVEEVSLAYLKDSFQFTFHGSLSPSPHDARWDRNQNYRLPPTPSSAQTLPGSQISCQETQVRALSLSLWV